MSSMVSDSDWEVLSSATCESLVSEGSWTKAGPLRLAGGAQLAEIPSQPAPPRSGSVVCADTVVNLIQGFRWADALNLLRTASDLKAGIEKSTALAWAAYKATSGRGEGAVQVIQELLKICPKDVVKPDWETGFLPLHEAAWGNAEPAVAELLMEAHPAGLNAKVRGQTPVGLGHYFHGRRFSWRSMALPEIPEIEEVEEKEPAMWALKRALFAFTPERLPEKSRKPTVAWSDSANECHGTLLGLTRSRGRFRGCAPKTPTRHSKRKPMDKEARQRCTEMERRRERREKYGPTFAC